MEAQEDIAGGQKRGEEVEEEGEDPYNEENIEQVSFAVSQTGSGCSCRHGGKWYILFSHP